MTSTTARSVLAGCLLILVVVPLGWLAWPDDEPRADLRVLPAIETSSTSTTTAVSTSIPVADSSSTSTSTSTSTTPTPAPAPLVTPERVRIPSIDLDAPVVPVALEVDGQMELPPATDVGWYRLGPSPGQAGSAVLAAHIDFGGARGVFFDLRSVSTGDEVIVDGDGTSRRFVVSQREQVAKDAVELDRYFTVAGPARITLITCGGVFDRRGGHYRDNVIITADLVP